MTTRFEVRNLSRRFGGLLAVSEVSFEVKAGEIFGIIGPNGAGKTTLFNLIAGIHKPTGGQVFYEGRDITGRSSDGVARLGIARTFQATRTFKESSVRDNLTCAALLGRAHNPIAYVRFRMAGKDALEAAAAEVARFIGLEHVLDTPAGGLAYGLQKILGIGMALMQQPTLVLMDEPAAGLNPSEKQTVAELIRRMRDERGIDVLVVEHDMRLIMGICDRILVINQGRRISLDTPDGIRNDQSVIDAYLGVDYEFA